MGKSDFLINKVVTNVRNYRRWYYLTTVVVISCMVIFNFFTYQYLFFIKKEKETAFVDGAEDSIRYLLQHELAVAFNQLSNLENLSITKNYSFVKGNSRQFLLSGSALYINRGKDSIILDLHPLMSLVNLILGSNFYYKVTLNDEILLTNVEDIDFSFVKKYPINEEVHLAISLLLKSAFPVKRYSENFEKQILLSGLGSIFMFSIIMALAFWWLNRKLKTNDINHKLLAIDKGWDLNANYIKLLHSEVAVEKSWLLQNHSKPSANPLQIHELIEEIEIFVLAYTSKFHYKFELKIFSEVTVLTVKNNSLLIKQVIISLLHNVLYFMRGGTHVKKLLFHFQKDNLTIIYDSFAANEDHMCKWSRGLFQHLGNPYILECDQLFQLIRSYGLTYEIIPKQGENKIVISLNKNEENNRVIKFKKSS